MTQAAYIVSESTDCETIKCGLETEISMKQDLEDHSHCDNCIKITKCRYKNTRDAACPIVYCIEGCGFKFHRCKSDEHKLLCANEKVDKYSTTIYIQYLVSYLKDKISRNQAQSLCSFLIQLLTGY